MEPFSAAAAAATLCPLIIQTARQLWNVARSIKYARRDLKALTDEMDIFSAIYEEFMHVTEKRMKRTKSASSARKRLIAWAGNAKLDFQKLSQRVDALSRDPLHKHSVNAMVAAHCKWFFSKSHLKYLRYTLVVARQSMVGFTHMCHIEKLDELLVQLRSGTSDETNKIQKKYYMTREQLIIHLEAKLKQLFEQAALTNDIAQEAIQKISSKQSRSQNKDYSEHTEQLLGFSRKVDRHIGRTLHPSSSSSQRSSPSSSSSRNTRRSRRVDSASQSSWDYLEPYPRHIAVDEMYQGTHRYTPSNLAEQNVERPRYVERLRNEAESQENEAERPRNDPNHVPPLSVPPRINETQPSILSTDTKPPAPPEPPRAPQIKRSETANGENGSNNGEISESELEDEISSGQATHKKDSIWQATGAFEGTEPRNLREKRQRGS